MSWIDELCLSCGLCCTTLSIVRITDRDLERLMAGYRLNREQAELMVRRTPNELRILMETTAACPALEGRDGKYSCMAYQHRPGICREYACFILDSARKWLASQAAAQPVDIENAFHSATTEAELIDLVREAITRMRSNALNSCVHHGNDPGFRRPDYMDKLIEVLQGADFKSSFPAVSGA